MKTAILLVALFGLAAAATQDPVPAEWHFECPSVGRFPHEDPTQRHLFYVCQLNNDGYLIAHPASCTDDMHFDLATHTCVRSDLFVCPDSGRFAHPLLNDRFYMCWENVDGDFSQMLIQCAEDNTFDHALGICVAEPKFECPSVGRHPHPTKDDQFYLCWGFEGHYTHQLYTCIAGDKYDPVKKVCEHHFVCPETGRFPHPNNDNQFYMCVLNKPGNLIPQLFSCAEGLIYHHGLQYCTAPEEEVDHFQCPATGDFPHHEDNVKFYRCELNDVGELVAYELTCTSDSYFDTHLRVCIRHIESIFTCPDEGRFADENHPHYYYKCELHRGVLIPRHKVCPDNHIFSSLTSLCEEMEEIETFECSTQGDFPHHSDNLKFWRCELNEVGHLAATLLTCTGDSYFDTQLRVCIRHIENIFTCLKEGRFPDPTNVNKYYKCELHRGELIPRHKTCPEGQHFDTRTEICAVTDDIETFECSTQGDFPHHSDNLKFWRCELNEAGHLAASLLTCSDDSYFDTHLRVCISHIDTFQCSTQGDFPHHSDNLKFWRCELNEVGHLAATLLTCTDDSYFDTQLRVCIRHIENIFTCLKEGRFPDPTNVNKYYKCELHRGELIPRHKTCPEGQHFDTRTEICEVTDDIDTFQCSTQGDFPHDSDNLKFWRCELNEVGHLAATLLTCTDDSYFDTHLRVCIRHIESIFTCTDEGRFADVNHPHYYFKCELHRGVLIPRHKVCPDNHIFSSLTSLCEEMEEIDTFQCTTQGDFQHNSDNTKFYRCELNEVGHLAATLLSCTGDSYFDTQQRVCVRHVENLFSCPSEGRFADENNEFFYFICELHRGQLIPLHTPCPGGLTFDSRSKVCGIIR